MNQSQTIMINSSLMKKEVMNKTVDDETNATNNAIKVEEKDSRNTNVSHD